MSVAVTHIYWCNHTDKAMAMPMDQIIQPMDSLGIRAQEAIVPKRTITKTRWHKGRPTSMPSHPPGPFWISVFVLIPIIYKIHIQIWHLAHRVVDLVKIIFYLHSTSDGYNKRSSKFWSLMSVWVQIPCFLKMGIPWTSYRACFFEFFQRIHV